jgi:hypothetical protein
MNSMAQHAVPNGMGHIDALRAQFTRKSSRDVTQLSYELVTPASAELDDGAPASGSG